MPLFNYTAINEEGKETKGTVDALNRDVAIRALQRRNLTVSSVSSPEEGSFLKKEIGFLSGVKNKDVVILSRQIATLFQAQVSALKVFSLLAAESDNPALRRVLSSIVDDLQGGSSISKAMSKHPKVFSEFYVNMVKVGEESGKLEEIFNSLADYLDRAYEVIGKARNALIYPAFVVATFVGVMILMLTTVIPRISGILEDAGQAVPIYTRIVIGLSNFFVDYGIFLLILFAIGVVFLWKYSKTQKGKLRLSRIKIETPYLGELYKKMYLARIADNMNTMLASGIPMVRALEITSATVDNYIYKNILNDAVKLVRGGSSVSGALSGHPEIPGIMTQMVRIGEESGELGSILKTLGHFYEREVNNAVDTLVGLIEPAMIVLLAAGVGVLLASVLIPIYNISGAI